MPKYKYTATDILRNLKGRWRDVLLNQNVPENILSGKHQECPLCGGKDRFRWTNYNNDGGYFCNQCGSGDGIALIKNYTGMSFIDVLKMLSDIEVKNMKVETMKEKPNPLIYLQKIYSGLRNINTKDAVYKYLKKRGLQKIIAHQLYYHPSIAYYEDGIYKKNYECMVGIVRNKSRKFITMHITYLDGGKKANVKSPKKILTPIETINGCAIRLYDYNGHLGIAEGIETAIACYELTGIPTWSVMNTSGMESFIPPDDVNNITVFADSDHNYAGQKAAFTLANKLVIKYNRTVDIQMPSKIGNDFLDVLNARG